MTCEELSLHIAVAIGITDFPISLLNRRLEHCSIWRVPNQVAKQDCDLRRMVLCPCGSLLPSHTAPDQCPSRHLARFLSARHPYANPMGIV